VKKSEGKTGTEIDEGKRKARGAHEISESRDSAMREREPTSKLSATGSEAEW